MANALTLLINAAAMYFLLMYWNSMQWFGHRIPYYIFSVILFVFVVLINRNHFHISKIICLSLHIKMFFMMLGIFAIAAFFSPHPAANLYVVKTSVSLLLLLFAGMALFSLEQTVRNGIYLAASFAFVSFILTLMIPTGEISILSVYSSLFEGEIREAATNWRIIFSGFEGPISQFDPKLHEFSNFRNGLSAALSTILIIVASGKNTVSRNILIFIISITIVSLYSISGIILMSSFLFIYLNFFRLYFLFILFILFLIFLIFFILFPDTVNALFKGYLINEYYERIFRSISARSRIYDNAVSAILASPIFGNGLGYSLDFNDKKVAAHNHFLTLWMQVGIIGPTAFAVFYLTLVKNFLRNILRKNANDIYFSRILLCSSLALLPALLRPMIGSSIQGLFSVGELLGIAFFLAVALLARRRTALIPQTKKPSHQENIQNSWDTR